MADSALLAVGGGNAPLSYLVPGSTAIRIKQIHVAYVDNGASGDWLPAVRIVSDSKHTMGLASDQGVKITAGSDADVSFFPGVKAAAAAAAAAGTSWAYMKTAAAGVSIASDAATHFVSIQDGVAGAKYEDDGGGDYTNGSSTLFTGSAVFGIQVQKAGTYKVQNNAFAISGGTVGKQLTTYWAASAGSAPSEFQQGRTSQNIGEIWDRGQAGEGPHLFTTELISVTSGQVPATFAVTGRINGGGGAVSTAFQMYVEKVSDYVATKL